MVLQNNRKNVFLFLATLGLAIGLTGNPQALADTFPPNWDGGAGAAVHHAPAAWPLEPANPADCGTACGDWKPYTRFQNSINDPRTQDPSNGGTAPQNYVNIASSCIDKDAPSIYYNLKKVDESDPTKDVIMFRWRVEQIANTYATGPGAGTYGATHPWSSALWTVLFDVDGSGYRSLAAHLNGSSGSPAAPIDMLAGIYGQLPVQSIDYDADPANIKLLGHNPTAFVDSGTGLILNFQNSVTPAASWPNGSAETVWDYGTTRALKVSTRSCTEYFIDYQIPVALLDATGHGGPKITRDTPIAMMFCTANSLNNPFQKDCAINRTWAADPGKPAPFGDYISFDQEQPYSQPIIRDVKAVAPLSCAPGQFYTLTAIVQDTLAVIGGEVLPSVTQVGFWYYHDVDGNGVSDDGSAWTFAANATRVAGTLNKWSASWDSSGAPKGRYLIGVQAVDNRLLVDDDMPPNPVDNRTFSYVTSNAMGEVYINGDTPAWKIDETTEFPLHSPGISPSTAQNWYGNPSVVGTQVAFAGFDVDVDKVDQALNVCGVAPGISKSADLSTVTVGNEVAFTITVTNPANNPSSFTLTELRDELPAGFVYKAGSSSGASTGDPAIGGQTLTWAANTVIVPGGSASLSFVAIAPMVTGAYSNTASALTSFSNERIVSEPVQITVGAARLSIGKTPNIYSSAPGGEIEYEIAFSNDSPVDATGAVITDILPVHLNYVADSCTGGCIWTAATRTLSWAVGNLAAGSGVSKVSFRAVVATPYTGPPSLQNTAAIDSDQTDPADATAAVYIDTPRPVLTISKTANRILVDPAAAAPGNQVVFTLDYANSGNADAGNVEISDPLPAGFTFVSATGGPSATPLAGQNGIVTWTFASLPAGTSGTVSVTAQVANPYTGIANPATNTASIKLGGVEMDSASVDVGVLLTGAQCTNYYLTDKQGYADTAETLLKNIATQDLTGLVAAQVSKVIGANAGTVEIARFYQDWPAAGTIDFSASASLSTFLDFTKVGNNLTVFVDVYAYDPADSTGDTSKVLIATGSANFTGNAKQTITTTIVPGALLPKNHKFLVVFSGRMNNQPQTATAYIGVNSATSSYLRLCSLPPANLVLSKTVDSALLNVTGSGRQLAYTLNYANTSGSQDATAALLEDILPTSGVTYQSCSVAGSHFIACGLNAGKVVFHDGLNGGVTIPAGASGTASVIVMVADDLSGIPSLVNIARIRSAQTGEQEATATTTITGEGSNEGGAPNVIIAKSANKTLLQPGDEVEYTLTVVNVGDKTATGIAVSDTLPATAYFTYKPGSISGGGSRDDSGNPLTWSIASLAPGARSDLRFSMQVAGSGVPAGLTPHDNTATLAYDGGGTATSNTVVATTTTNPILGLQKTASVPLAPATTFVPGDDIEYTLTVTNTGSGAATAVRVVDPIPLYARFNAITATPVGGASQFDAVNNRVVLDIASLEAGASATLKFKVVLNDALPAGSTSIPNAASASAGNSASATANATSTASAAPDLAISKSGPASIPYPAATLTAAAAGENTLFVSGTAGLEIGQLVKIGAIVTQVESFSAWTLTVADAITAPIDAMVAPAATFGITYRNIGNAAASGAVLTDALPAGFGYHSASPTADTNPGAGNSGNVVWNLGTLAPGVSGTVRLVAFPTGTTGELVNTAGIALNETDPDMANNSDEARVAVGGLTVRKSTSTPVRNPGGTARYTITISNSLSTAVGNISVSDILPAGFQYVAGTGQVNAVSTEPNGGGSAPVPTWTGLSVPASGSLTLEFDALIDANTGSATYQNDVETSGPVGVGITPFDPLATPAEDVTVIGNDLGLVDGVVFIDHNGNGIFDAGVDAVLSGIKVVVDDAQPNPYTVNTDENGYFSVIVPVGGYTVRVNDETLPPGAVALAQNSTNPTPVTVPAGGQVTDDTGFVTASGTTPDLAIAKTHTGNFAQGQSGATYTLTVSNAGSAATSGEVSVTDTLPSGLIATAISGDGWTCVLATLTCVRSDALAASLSYPILTLTVDVASDAPATVTNTASVSGGGESYTANNSASDETAILPTYTVTYDGNGSTGGTAPVDGSSPYEAGAPVTVLAVGDLVRDGYTFAGWNTAADGSGAAHASGAGFVMPAANVTLYAQWTLIPPPPTFTVTYDGNGNIGGTAPVDGGNPYVAGAPVTVLAVGDLVRDGYSFAGWNTAADGSGAAHAPGAGFVMPAANVTLYAQWTLIPPPPTYTVTYDGNGNTGGTTPVDGSSPYVAGAPVSVLAVGDLVRDGYTFAGWNTAADGSGAAHASGAGFVMPAADVTLYAQWSAIPLPDVFATIALPGEVDASGTLHALVAFGNIGDALAAGMTYAVTGLPTGLSGVICIDATCNYDSATGTVTVTGLPTSLSPGQQPAPMQLSFNAPASGTVTLTAHIATTTDGETPTANNSAAASAIVNAAQAEVTTAVNAPAQADANGPVQGQALFMNIGNQTATGVIYNLAGLDAAGLSPQLSRNGIACAYDAVTGVIGGCDLPATLSPGQQLSIDILYTAPSSGTVTVISTVDAGNDTNSANNTASTSTTVSAVPLADVTAQITPPASGTVGIPVPVTVRFANLGPATAEGVTYKLTGLPAGSVVEYGGQACTVAGDGALSACNLPASLNPGQSLDLSISYTPTAVGSITLSAEIATTTLEVTVANNIASGTTIVAAAPTYTVTYDGNGNTGGTAPVDGGSPYAAGAPVTVLAVGDLVRDGYTFAGWNTAADGSGTAHAPGAGFVMPAADVTLYAQWTANPTYTVTYDGNGNTGGTAPVDGGSPYEAGAPVTVLAVGDLVRDGYTFAGWNTATDGSGTAHASGAGFVMPAANVTLYAQWTFIPPPPTYTVTYDGNGSTGGTAPVDGGSPYEAGAPVTVLAVGDLVRDGYTFAGWNTAADGSGTAHASGAGFVMPAADVTLYAQWVLIPPPPTFTVTYDGNGNTGGTAPVDGGSPYEAGAPVTVLAVGDLVRDGYTFAGWNTATDGSGTAHASGAGFVMPAANITLYAQWSAIPVVDVYTTIMAPASGETGSTVEVTVAFGNQGANPAQSLTYTLSLSPGLENVACTGAASCLYDPVSGQLALTGLPATLDPAALLSLAVRYTMPASGPVGVHSEIASTSVETLLDNNIASAETLVAASLSGALTLTKTAYLGHDIGAGCPGAKELVYVNKDRLPVAVTWCFSVTNTGTARLDQPVFSDAALGVTPSSQAGMMLKSGVFPLAPGETAVWYYEEVRDISLVNFADLEMTVVDGSGNPVPGALPVLGHDTVATNFGYVFDPPFGVKTGQIQGRDVVRWTMVWVNDNVINADGVVITDPPPVGMTMLGAPTCTPHGITTVDLCTFDPPDISFPRGRVRVLANFGPDFGVTLGTVNQAPNRLEIAFDVLVDQPDREQSFANQARAVWTQPATAGEPNPGPFESLTYDLTQLEGLDPATVPSDIDPGVLPVESHVRFIPPVPVPVMGSLGLLLLGGLMGLFGLGAVRRRSA